VNLPAMFYGKSISRGGFLNCSVKWMRKGRAVFVNF